MQTTMLSPMSTAELQDGAFTVVREGGWAMLAATMPGAMAAYLCLQFVYSFLLTRLAETSNPTSISTQAFEVFCVLLLTWALAVPLLMVFVSAVSALVTRVAGNVVLGRPVDVPTAARLTQERLFRLVKGGWLTALTTFVPWVVTTGLLLAGAMLHEHGTGDEITGALAILVGIFGLIWTPLVAAQSMFVPSAIMFEDLSAKDALKRSRTLYRASKLPRSMTQQTDLLLIGTAFIVLFIFLGVNLILQFTDVNEQITGMFGSGLLTDLIVGAIRMVPGFVALWSWLLLGSSGAALAYFDRRIRWEGFDVDQLQMASLRQRRRTRFLL